MDLSGVDIIVNAVVGKSLREQVGCNPDIFNRVKERVRKEVSNRVAKGHEELDIILMQKKRLQATFCGEKLLYEALHKKDYEDDLVDDASEDPAVMKAEKNDKIVFEKQRKHYGKENESRKYPNVKVKDSQIHNGNDRSRHGNGKEDGRHPERGKEKNHRRSSSLLAGEKSGRYDKPYKYSSNKDSERTKKGEPIIGVPKEMKDRKCYDKGKVKGNSSSGKVDELCKDISWVVLDKFEHFENTEDTIIDEEAVIQYMLASDVDFVKTASPDVQKCTTSSNDSSTSVMSHEASSPVTQKNQDWLLGFF